MCAGVAAIVPKLRLGLLSSLSLGAREAAGAFPHLLALGLSRRPSFRLLAQTNRLSDSKLRWYRESHTVGRSVGSSHFYTKYCVIVVCGRFAH